MRTDAKQSTIVTPIRWQQQNVQTICPTTEAKYSSSGLQQYHPVRHEKEVSANGHTSTGFYQDPLPFSVNSLPLPCAYLRLPWDRKSKVARLLPAKTTPNDTSLSYRQYVKRTIVEEVTFSPPYYILRYCHMYPQNSHLGSRLAPFVACVRGFPSVQALTAYCHNAQMPPKRLPLVTCSTMDSIYDSSTNLYVYFRYKYSSVVKFRAESRAGLQSSYPIKL